MHDNTDILHLRYLYPFPFSVIGSVEGFNWIHRCCRALLCLDTVDPQEYISKSQVSGCWTWYIIFEFSYHFASFNS